MYAPNWDNVDFFSNFTFTRPGSAWFNIRGLTTTGFWIIMLFYWEFVKILCHVWAHSHTEEELCVMSSFFSSSQELLSLCLSVCVVLITGGGSGVQVSGGGLLIIPNLVCFKYRASRPPCHQIVDSHTQIVLFQLSETSLLTLCFLLSLDSSSLILCLETTLDQTSFLLSRLSLLAPLCQFPFLAPSLSLGLRLPVVKCKKNAKNALHHFSESMWCLQVSCFVWLAMGNPTFFKINWF